jgi:hypothetical protein
LCSYTSGVCIPCRLICHLGESLVSCSFSENEYVQAREPPPFLASAHLVDPVQAFLASIHPCVRVPPHSRGHVHTHALHGPQGPAKDGGAGATNGHAPAPGSNAERLAAEAAAAVEKSNQVSDSMIRVRGSVCLSSGAGVCVRARACVLAEALHSKLLFRAHTLTLTSRPCATPLLPVTLCSCRASDWLPRRR